MNTLIVVGDPADWALSIPGVELVAARSYLTDVRYSALRRVQVFNLCRSYRYQSVGYYVSLLAEARGHRPQPNVATIQDMKLQAPDRLLSEETGALCQKTLRPLRHASFTLSIYFGDNMAARYRRLCLHLFNLFPAPLLRAEMVRERGTWRLCRIGPIPASEIPASHQAFVAQAAGRYFDGHRRRLRRPRMHYDMAILYNEADAIKPSNPRAIDRFVRAARTLGIDAAVIARSDVGHIAEYDALFVRETTAVNHPTFRICRLAAAMGLVVIDDPDSILRCTNKVYLAQLLHRHRIHTPKTLIIHRDNVGEVERTLGLPCILKQPDSSFSQGVVKAHDAGQLRLLVERLLERSELIVGQAFVPTAFDWRIGVLDGAPLYACRYHMAKNHWQIIKRDAAGRPDYGKVDTLPVESVPPGVVDAAVRAAGLIGDGLYGVDLKEVDGRSVVIEVNDNPSIDAGFEDRVLKEQLYLRIMASFLRRLEMRSQKARTT